MKRYVKSAVVKVNDESLEDRIAIAGDPDTTVDVLESLVDDRYMGVLTALASNHSTPLWVLGKFIDEYERGEGRYEVAQNVARNPSTPVSLLRKLQDSSCDDVLIALVENPNTPKDVLMHIADNCTNLYVAEAIVGMKNPGYDTIMGLLVSPAGKRSWNIRNQCENILKRG